MRLPRESRSIASSPRGPRRMGAWLCVALVGLSLAGCADDPPSVLPVLVEVGAHKFDGAPPSHDLAVRQVGLGTLGPPVALVPVPGRANVYEARGAVAGRYLLVLPGEWSALYSGNPPYLQPDGRPTRMNAGRAHTMYCASTSIDRPLGEVWGARRVEPSGALGAALHIDVRSDDNGWVLLRFKAEEWAGPMALQGRFADGQLTELMLTTPSPGGRPILRQMNGEPTAPLLVTVVGADAMEAPPWVHARVLGLPLDEVQQRPVREGAARFEGLATSRDGLELTVGDGSGAPKYFLATEAWARDGDVRLYAPLPGRHPVRLPAPPGAKAKTVRVQLRAEAGSSYGWVPATAEDGAVRLDVAPGAWRALIATAGGFAASRFRVEPDGTLADLVAAPFEAAATVRGTVSGAGGERVLWERQEDGRSVLGHGFVVRARGGGAFEAVLPPGAYQMVIETALGTRGQPHKIDLVPGGQVSVAREAPPDPPKEGERPR